MSIAQRVDYKRYRVPRGHRQRLSAVKYIQQQQLRLCIMFNLEI